MKEDNVIPLTRRPQEDDDFIHAAWEMEKMGGFAYAIAKAYYVADKQNRLRLRVAFPDLFVAGFNAITR